jgi:hypothetical protein
VRGPYTGRGPLGSGDFWTETLPGETVVIEAAGVAKPRWELVEVAHFDKDPAGLLDANKASARGFGQDPLEDHTTPTMTCHEDVMCHGDNPLLHSLARDATVAMNLVRPTGTVHWCSGTILNDLDDETPGPYFLSAFHCVSTQAVADTMEIVYGWQRPSCGGTLPNYANLPRTTGARLLVTNSTTTGNDMSFFRLNGQLPGGTARAGWTTAVLPTTFAGVHHPAGSWKRVSFFRDRRVVDPCSSTPTSQYHYVLTETGITEGGSSGSAIFDSGARVMGQLLGACPPTTPGFVAGCNNRNQWNTVYGRFDVTFPLIRRWLEIGGTINVNGSSTHIGPEEGTPTRPFRTVIAANDLINSTAWNGARIRIWTGTYVGAVTFTRAMTLIAQGGTVTLR